MPNVWPDDRLAHRGPRVHETRDGSLWMPKVGWRALAWRFHRPPPSTFRRCCGAVAQRQPMIFGWSRLVGREGRWRPAVRVAGHFICVRRMG